MSHNDPTLESAASDETADAAAGTSSESSSTKKKEKKTDENDGSGGSNPTTQQGDVGLEAAGSTATGDTTPDSSSSDAEARRDTSLEDATSGSSASNPAARRRDTSLEDATGGQSAADTTDPSVVEGAQETLEKGIENAPEEFANPLGEGGEQLAADQRRDLGDTAVKNPLTGNRLEQDLQNLTGDATSLAADAQQTVPTQSDVVLDVGAAAADAAGFDQAAENIRRGDRLSDRAQRGGAESVLTAIPGGALAAKEAGETLTGVASGDVSGREVAAQTLRTVDDAASFAVNNPARFAGGLVGGAAVGTSATLGTIRATQAAGRAAIRARADGSARFRDTTSERTAETGDLPEFRTDPDAPTEQAVREVRQRAADAPEQISERVGTESVLFRSETDRLPGSLEAQRGEFELPGLFVSPDTSTLRSSFGADESGGISARLPRPSDFTPDVEQFSAFPGDRVEAAPDSAAESGFLVRGPDGEPVERFPPTQQGADESRALEAAIDGQREPDPDTAGAQFLDEQAEEGVAFVRPPGDRRSELEAVFPPESRFDRTGEIALTLPDGRVGRLDTFRRRDEPDTPPQTADIPPEDRNLTPEEVADRSRSRSRSGPDDDPAGPPLGGSGASGSSSDGSESSTTAPPTSTDPELTSPTRPPDETDSGGASAPPSSPPTAPPTTPPSGPTSRDPTSPPSEPPATPPSEPPTSPPSRPPSSPPSSPPTNPPAEGGESGGPGAPGSPPGSDTRRPRIGGDPEDEREEESPPLPNLFGVRDIEARLDPQEVRFDNG